MFQFVCDVVKDTGKEEYLRPFVCIDRKRKCRHHFRLLIRHVNFQRHLNKYADCINTKYAEITEFYILWRGLTKR